MIIKMLSEEKQMNKIACSVKCWEHRKCDRKGCPAYKSGMHCWLVPGTFCGNEIAEAFRLKMMKCIKCPVFTENMKSDLWKPTIEQIIREFEQSVSQMGQESALSKIKEKIIIANLKEVKELSRGLTDALEELGKAKLALEELSGKLEKKVQRRTVELTTANKKLEQINSELKDFAYIASHDLREPLRKISSFGELLKGSLAGKLTTDDEENF